MAGLRRGDGRRHARPELLISATSPIELYDATLRDGMQGEGMSLSAAEKLRVAHRLDELGIDVIEAGFPASNPKERELFELLAAERFAHAQIAAFGMTRRRDVTAAEDPALQVLGDCFAGVCTLVGKTWGLHLEKVVRVDREENLAMIGDSIAYLRGRGKRVIYDAEHFFDGYRDDREYALACLRAAAAAGADTHRAVRHQRGIAAPSGDRGDGRRRHRARTGDAGGHPLPQRRRVGWPTRSPPCSRGPLRCRARSTGAASAAATPTSCRSSPTCS